MIHANPDKRSRLRNASVHANEAATNLIVVPFSFSFFASRCRAQQDISKGGEGGLKKRVSCYRVATISSFFLSFTAFSLFPIHSRERERRRRSGKRIRYDIARELKTETRFCGGGGGGERRGKDRRGNIAGLVIRASSRRGEYIAIIYINTVDAVTINSCAHEGIEWNIKFPGGSKP